MTATTAPETIWMSGVVNEHLRVAAAAGAPVGVLCQPGNSYELQIDHFPLGWAADNAAFAKGARFETFDFARFDDYIDRRLARLTDDQKARCRFVNAPDAIDVCGKDCGIDLGGRACTGGVHVTSYPEVTLERFAKYAPRIRAIGVPVALVGQPGMELMIDELPWDELDVVFLGGDDGWKLGEGARILTEAARARGKVVHCGRVNSGKRLRYAASIGCSTADGTFLLFDRSAEGVQRVLRWFAGIPALPPAPPAPAVLVAPQAPLQGAAIHRLHRCPECGQPTTEPELCQACIDRLAGEGSDLLAA